VTGSLLSLNNLVEHSSLTTSPDANSNPSLTAIVLSFLMSNLNKDAVILPLIASMTAAGSAAAV